MKYYEAEVYRHGKLLGKYKSDEDIVRWHGGDSWPRMDDYIYNECVLWANSAEDRQSISIKHLGLVEV